MKFSVNLHNKCKNTTLIKLQQTTSPLFMKRKFKQVSSNPLENIITDPQSGVQTRSDVEPRYGHWFLNLMIGQSLEPNGCFAMNMMKMVR